jgi:hypothetical protein
MRKLLSVLAFVVLAAAMMYGQASRTWVSGVGDDANPCSRTAPCKTFAGAISKTAPGGEIDALDPGGFGALTITKAITIDGGGGQVASVLVAGTNGIVVQAGPSDVVILRNLRINGIGSGFNGVRFLSGKDLNIESCYIFGFTQNGLDIALNQGTQATVHVINSVFKNNTGDGIRATNAIAPVVKVGIYNTQVMVSGTNGIEASTNSRVSVDHGFISASGGSAVASNGTSGSSIASVDYSDLIDGNSGITTSNGSFAVVGHTTMTGNTGTAYNTSSGTIFAYSTSAANATNGTNRVHDNGGTGTPIYITEN